MKLFAVKELSDSIVLTGLEDGKFLDLTITRDSKPEDLNIEIEDSDDKVAEFQAAYKRLMSTDKVTIAKVTYQDEAAWLTLSNGKGLMFNATSNLEEEDLHGLDIEALKEIINYIPKRVAVNNYTYSESEKAQHNAEYARRTDAYNKSRWHGKDIDPED